MAVSGAIFITLMPLPRHILRTPPSFSMHTRLSEIPLRDVWTCSRGDVSLYIERLAAAQTGLHTLTCRNTFSLSNGAVHVRETAPAMPPAAKCRHHFPVCISFGVKSSGTFMSSPMSRYWVNKINTKKTRVNKNTNTRHEIWVYRCSVYLVVCEYACMLMSIPARAALNAFNDLRKFKVAVCVQCYEQQIITNRWRLAVVLPFRRAPIVWTAMTPSWIRTLSTEPITEQITHTTTHSGRLYQFEWIHCECPNRNDPF